MPNRTLPRVLSGLGGLVLTPAGLWLTSHGGELERQSSMAAFRADHDPLGLALLLFGAVLLLGTAALGAVSSTGPLLGGLGWGVVPGVVAVVDPFFVSELVGNTGLLSWLSTGAVLGVGVLLTGAGAGAAVTRRRRVTPSAHGTVHGAGSAG